MVSDQGAGEDYYALLRNIKRYSGYFRCRLYDQRSVCCEYFSRIHSKIQKRYGSDPDNRGNAGTGSNDFSSMSFVISGCACLAGAMFSALVPVLH